MVYLGICKEAELGLKLEKPIIDLTGGSGGAKARVKGLGFLFLLGIWKTSQKKLDKIIYAQFLWGHLCLAVANMAICVEI